MKHPDEQSIEQYLLDAPGSRSRRPEIDLHLKECEGCAALLREMEGYYEEVDRLNQSSRQAVTVVDRVLPHTAGGGGAVATLPAKAWSVIRAHPVASSAGTLALAAVVSLLFLNTWKSSSLAHARHEGEFLVAYDADWNAVWKKHIGLGYPADPRGLFMNLPLGLKNVVDCIDVDGDGEREVIVIKDPLTMVPRNSLVCFDRDGNERWSFSMQGSVTFGGTEFSDNYRVRFFFTSDPDTEGRVDIYGYAQHLTYYPSAVFKLDGRTGRTTGEYWHCGWLETGDYFDIDNDGVKELVLGGENNSYNEAAILILDPRIIDGYGPVANDFRPGDFRPGSEVAYILVPRVDLAASSTSPRNKIASFTPSTHTLEATIQERYSGTFVNVANVFFDSTLACIRVAENDDFVSFYRSTVAQGKKAPPLKAIYESIRTGIRYWDGTRFSPLPTLKKPAVTLR